MLIKTIYKYEKLVKSKSMVTKEFTCDQVKNALDNYLSYRPNLSHDTYIQYTLYYEKDIKFRLETKDGEFVMSYIPSHLITINPKFKDKIK